MQNSNWKNYLTFVCCNTGLLCHLKSDEVYESELQRRSWKLLMLSRQLKAQGKIFPIETKCLLYINAQIYGHYRSSIDLLRHLVSIGPDNTASTAKESKIAPPPFIMDSLTSPTKECSKNLRCNSRMNYTLHICKIFCTFANCNRCQDVLSCLCHFTHLSAGIRSGSPESNLSRHRGAICI